MKACTIAMLLSAFSTASLAGTPPIPPLDFVYVTPNEGYAVYIDPDPLSDHYFSPTKALAASLALDRTGVAGPGNPRGYHEGYMNLEFRYPYFSELPKSVYYYDCKNPTGDASISCDNGMAPVANILMPVTEYGGISDSCVRVVQGHELFHHVEFAYADEIGLSGCSAVWGNTACEGQARAMQDKIYLDLDLVPSASCIGTFLGQVNGYLDDTNQYLWSSSYDSALFWTYLMEQFGQLPLEPGRGADFITNWWDHAEVAGEDGIDAFAITNDTILDYDPARNVFTEFRAFAIANLIKDFDLSSSSAAFVNRYSYRDEDPVLLSNQMDFNDVTVEFDVDLGGGEEITTLMGVQYFGARYLRVDVQDCPTNRIMRMEIDAANTTSAGVDNLAGYGVVAIRNNRPVSFYKKFAVDWGLTLFQTNPRIDELYLVVAPIAGFWAGNVSVSCDPPETTFDLDFPLLAPTHPWQGGPPAAQAFFQVDVVPTIDRFRPFIGGLTRNDFQARVGGLEATVLDVIQTQDSYRLQLQLPPQPAAGGQGLDILLGGSVFSVPDAIVHGDFQADVMIALDTSTSMLFPPNANRLDAVRQVGQFLVEALPEATRMGLISYAGNDFEPDIDAQLIVPLDVAGSVIRDRIKVGIGNLSSGPNRLTSIGDALQLALDQFNARGGADSARHLVLLSDGSENEGLFYADVRDSLIAAGIRVHTIAFGPQADQGLLAQIARDTGGAYRYAAVLASATDELGLYAAFGQIAGVIGGRQILSEASGALQPGQTLVIEQPVGTVPMLVPAIQSARAGADRTPQRPEGTAGTGGNQLIASLRVFRPDGSELLDGQNGARIVNGGDWYTIVVPQLMAGRWRYEIIGGANANGARVDVDIAGRAADRYLQVASSPADRSDSPATRIESGDVFRLNSSLVSPNPRAHVHAEIIGCDGSVRTATVPTGTDDGFDDLIVGSGPVLHSFDMMVAAGPGSPTGFADDPSQPGQCGSYRVRMIAEFPDGTHLLAHEVVHVLQTANFADADRDSLPDRYEDRLACLNPNLPDATLDPDGDGVPSRFEYEEGTDPCNPDSDAGGETDGSERREGRSALDARDDLMRRPVDVYPLTELSEHEEEQPLARNAISLRPPRQAGIASWTLLRGTNPAALSPIATLSPNNIGARYVDTMNLIPGQTYHYQWRGIDVLGNEGAPSHVFPMRATSDTEAPMGASVLHRGLPRTDDPDVELKLSLYNDAPATTRYRVRTLICPSEPALAPSPPAALPFSEFSTLQMPEVSAECTFGVSVVLIDVDGNESVKYTDDLALWPRGSLGDVRGTLFVPGGTPLRAIVEIAGEPHEAPALADANGNFLLADLKPGTYDLDVSLPGYETRRIPDVIVDAGQITDLPVTTLVPVDAQIFADGFESP